MLIKNNIIFMVFNVFLFKANFAITKSTNYLFDILLIIYYKYYFRL